MHNVPALFLLCNILLTYGIRHDILILATEAGGRVECRAALVMQSSRPKCCSMDVVTDTQKLGPTILVANPPTHLGG